MEISIAGFFLSGDKRENGPEPGDQDPAGQSDDQHGKDGGRDPPASPTASPAPIPQSISTGK